MRATTAGLILALALLGGFQLGVRRTDAPSLPAGSYAAVVQCPGGIAEDSAGHVRLIEYGGGTITYQCEREGY